MTYRWIPLAELVVNPANDRHGELENETAAIARLFALRESHMKTLAKDLVSKGEVFEPPLVYPDSDRFVVADGNRRTTCLKLLAEPHRAPTVQLQQFFKNLRDAWTGEFPTQVQCRIETDRDRIDEILYRRHTGSQGGIGQSTWDDRMKNNFVLRSGMGDGINVADEIEKRLTAHGMLPKLRIPRSNMNRLMSAEAIRNRVGFSVKGGKFGYLREQQEVHRALHRIASDLATGQVTLDDIWDSRRKLQYIDKLDEQGLLPRPGSKPSTEAGAAHAEPPKRKPVTPAQARHTLIPHLDYAVVWVGELQRHRAIWDELQFKLHLAEHPNAISVLFRVLLELAVERYIDVNAPASIHPNDNLGKKMLKVAEHLHSREMIDQKYRDLFKKAQHIEQLVSADTLNRYIHSPQFAPSPEHLKSLWDHLAEYVVKCLNASRENA